MARIIESGASITAKQTPRVIVPKHRKWMGWTLNFARPGAVPALLCIMALLGLPVLMVRANGGGTVVCVSIGVVSVVIVCLLSAYLSSTKRWSRWRQTQKQTRAANAPDKAGFPAILPRDEIKTES